MWRRLVLITSPSEKGTEEFRPGVYLDLQNYCRFFSSPIGGSYSSLEIIHLDSPTFEDIQEMLRSIPPFYYAVLIYCGHSFLSPEGRTILQLRGPKDMDSMELARCAAYKTTVILDSCRVMLPEPLDIGLRKSLVEVAPKVILDPNKCRDLFNSSLAECVPGTIQVFASQRGNYAFESRELGGLFSHSLLSAAEAYVRNYDAHSGKPMVRSIVDIFDDVNALLKQVSDGEQEACIDTTQASGRPSFPFLVIA